MDIKLLFISVITDCVHKEENLSYFSKLCPYSTHTSPTMPARAASVLIFNALCVLIVYAFVCVCVFVCLVKHSHIHRSTTSKLRSHCIRLQVNNKLLLSERAIVHLFAVLRPWCMHCLFTHLFTLHVCV